jgi:phosphoglycolate phosphatase
VLNALIDLDGTIADPRAGWVACMRIALRDVRCPLPSDDELARHIGPPLRETVRAILGDAHRGKEARVLEVHREHYQSGRMLETSIYPGIPEMLAELRRRGARAIVATSKPTVFSVKILEHFGLATHFAAIHGCDLDGTRANKKDLIAHILASESLDPSRTTMIGDRAQDIVGAKANGIASIGALWGYGSRDELVEAGASALCQNPSMLCEVFFRS